MALDPDPRSGAFADLVPGTAAFTDQPLKPSVPFYGLSTRSSVQRPGFRQCPYAQFPGRTLRKTDLRAPLLGTSRRPEAISLVLDHLAA